MAAPYDKLPRRTGGHHYQDINADGHSKLSLGDTYYLARKF